MRQSLGLISIGLNIVSINAFVIPISHHVQPRQQLQQNRMNILRSTASDLNGDDFENIDPSPPAPTAMDQFQSIKDSLLRECQSSSPDKSTVVRLAKELELMAEQVGMGQASSQSGLLAGEWTLLYATEDDTRSSPFFWAFRKTFPTNAEQIFSITDAIPAPIKEVGPATQTISLTDNILVSRVKVATLNGLATSIMTTRCTITNRSALDSIVVQVDTTKPEKSTVLEKLGPLGAFIQDNSQAFPSGQALERVQPGGSFVVIESTFCDEGLRISRDGESNSEDLYIWTRTSFEAGSDI